jgi:hypothetical protein
MKVLVWRDFYAENEEYEVMRVFDLGVPFDGYRKLYELLKKYGRTPRAEIAKYEKLKVFNARCLEIAQEMGYEADDVFSTHLLGIEKEGYEDALELLSLEENEQYEELIKCMNVGAQEVEVQ